MEKEFMTLTRIYNLVYKVGKEWHYAVANRKKIDLVLISLKGL